MVDPQRCLERARPTPFDAPQFEGRPPGRKAQPRERATHSAEGASGLLNAGRVTPSSADAQLRHITAWGNAGHRSHLEPVAGTRRLQRTGTRLSLEASAQADAGSWLQGVPEQLSSGASSWPRALAVTVCEEGCCLSGCHPQPLAVVFGHAHGRSPAWQSSVPTIAPRVPATFSRRRGLRRLPGEGSLERRVCLPPLSGGGRAVPLRKSSWRLALPQVPP